MENKATPPIPSQYVKTVLSRARLFISSNNDNSKSQRIKFSKLKSILESELGSYAEYNSLSIADVVYTIITTMEIAHGKLSILKENLLDELEFELNNFHHNEIKKVKQKHVL